ncbi:MAG: FG-GAP repeat protein, partial [Actinomycetota bacterium]
MQSDFNGDGFADLAVGVPQEGINDARGNIMSGAVNVLYGSAGGLQADSPDDQVWHQNSPGVQDVAEGLELFGSALAAGDYNADGFGDLAVGVPWESFPGGVDLAGAVNVLYGSAGGLQADSPDDQFW